MQAIDTVEPPNKGHFGDTASVQILEVVLFSEVKKVLMLYGKGTWRSVLCTGVVPFLEGPLSDCIHSLVLLTRCPGGVFGVRNSPL